MGEWRITGDPEPEPVCPGCEELESEIAQLLEVLDKLARLGNEPHYGNSIGNRIAFCALPTPDDEEIE